MLGSRDNGLLFVVQLPAPVIISIICCSDASVIYINLVLFAQHFASMRMCVWIVVAVWRMLMRINYIHSRIKRRSINTQASVCACGFCVCHHQLNKRMIRVRHCWDWIFKWNKLQTFWHECIDRFERLSSYAYANGNLNRFTNISPNCNIDVKCRRISHSDCISFGRFKGLHLFVCLLLRNGLARNLSHKCTITSYNWYLELFYIFNPTKFSHWG